MNDCCRNARSFAFSEALSLFSWRKTKPQICQEIEAKMLDAMGSNQSKGEKKEGE